MTLKHHDVPASSECRISPQMRTPAPTIRPYGRVASNVVLAFLLLLLAGAGVARAQVTVFENAEAKVTVADGKALTFTDNVPRAFTIQNKAGLTGLGNFRIECFGYGSLSSNTVSIADGATSVVSMTWDQVTTAPATSCDVQVDDDPPINGVYATLGSINFQFLIVINQPGFSLTVKRELAGWTVKDALSTQYGPTSTGAQFVITAQHLTVDYSGSPVLSAFPTDGINFTGTLAPASLTLTGNTLGPAITNVQYGFLNENDGSVTIDGQVITYQDLTPITDLLVVANKTFDYSGVLLPADHEILLNAAGDGAANNNISFIDCVGCGEEVSFRNPTTSLVVTSGVGADTVYLYPLDTSAGSIPTIAVTVNGGLGTDHFHAAPVLTATPGGYTSFTVNGGAPVICPGDELHVDAAFEPAILSLAPSPMTFTIYDPIAYTGIEAFPNYHADVQITASPTLYPGDLATYTLTVKNNGPAAAQCIVVEDALPAGLHLLGPVTTSAGFLSPSVLTGPDWIISTLASGGTATLVVDVFVDEWQPITVTATTGTTDDVLSNNSVNLIGQTFRFPAATVAQKALVYKYVVDDDGPGPNPAVTFERLIVGLYQGAPGLTGAVLCQIPVPVPSTSFYYTVNPAFVANRWRECATGLPYPLHPNDLMEDANGRIWLATWGYAGLYYSDDGAQTWIESEPDLVNVPNGWVNIFAIAEDVSGFLYISANDGKGFFSLNGGNTWVQGGSLPWVAADTPWSLVADPTALGVVYAGTFGRGVFVSYDFTHTWQPLGYDAVFYPANPDEVNDDLIDLSQGHIFDLEFSPDFPNVLFAATALGVFKINLTAPLLTRVWVDTMLRLPGSPIPMIGPEVRSLAFDVDGLDLDDDLYVATWGFGVYRLDDPVLGPLTWDFYQLRNQEVTFVAPGPDGGIMAGTSSGEIIQLSASVSTANETDATADVPTEFELGQNYPNPFNPTTTIEFSMPEATAVRLAVYDMLGREVKVLVNGVVPAGRQTVQFDATGLPSGNYLYRMTSSLGSATKHLVLLK